jgi:hypothetical protein
METAIIQAPQGDRFLNRELWTLADDQVLSLELKARLEENGFRIGQIGGVTPPGLQSRLTSERTCTHPLHIEGHAGQATTIKLGPILPVCRFQVHQEERETSVTLEHAQCTLSAVPSLTADGRTRLRFTPEIQHGTLTVIPQPSADRTIWTLPTKPPIEAYPDLSWEVTLEPNEYVVVGGIGNRPDTLGYQCFVRAEESDPGQRLLVIRTAGAVPANESGSDPAEPSSPPRSALPLALQAILNP